MKYSHKNSGFIALTSVMFISSILMLFVSVQSESISDLYRNLYMIKARLTDHYNATSCLELEKLSEISGLTNTSNAFVCTSKP